MLWIAIGVGLVVLLGIGALVLAKGGGLPSKFPPGTRAFEADLTLPLLMQAIEMRLAQKRQTTAPDQLAKLERDIAFLSKQVDENTAIVDAKDTSPGRGYVAFQAPPD